MKEFPNNNQVSLLRKRISVFIGVLIIFIIGGGVLVFFLMNAESTILSVKVNNESTISENKTLSNRMERLKLEYEAIDIGYRCLDSLVMIQKLQVTEMLTSIQEMKVTDFSQKEKIKTLEDQLTNYLSKIEELEGRNKLLLAQYDIIKFSFDSVLNQNVAMAVVKSPESNAKNNKTSAKDMYEYSQKKYGESSILNAYEIRTMTFRSDNGKSDVPNNKASRVSKLRINFVLKENQIANTGKVNIYYRIVAPDGNVVTNITDKFDYNGRSLTYSGCEKIDYYNKSTDVKLNWDCSKTLVKGMYYAEIFSDNIYIGQTQFSLE